ERLASPAYPPYALAFDVEKLSFELNFFATHFMEGSRGVRFSAGAREALGREFAAMVRELAAEPRVLCHRDYHSRNLMLHDNRLHVIDFQDARMGPDTYDLASLLRDSYVTLPDAEVDHLIDAFLDLRHPGAAGTPAARRAFVSRLHLMALQRNLKALGTFGFQAVSRANDAYLQYVPRTLGYVRAYLGAYPRFGALRTLLAEHLPELR
ncbi:MAG: phosphotransferase, partial [Vicinamibacterales bacterium]|nr:phosphotransferase [Vicinamibacterales bacterium]